MTRRLRGYGRGCDDRAKSPGVTRRSSFLVEANRCVVGLGAGMTAQVLGATVATRWFSARRGLAVGMLTASNATGQLVFPPLLASVTQHWGWRAALALVVSLLLTALVFVFALMRDRRSDVGLAPFGERALVKPSAPGRQHEDVAAVAADRAARGQPQPCVLDPRRHLLRLRLSTNGLIQTHWITLCGD